MNTKLGISSAHFVFVVDRRIHGRDFFFNRTNDTEGVRCLSTGTSHMCLTPIVSPNATTTTIIIYTLYVNALPL